MRNRLVAYLCARVLLDVLLGTGVELLEGSQVHRPMGLWPYIFMGSIGVRKHSIMV
jgi:hypothetical protein